MLKYFIALVFMILVILTIGFVRNNYLRRLKNPLHTELQLAANFGELRPDHFHMGLDIRTNGKEDLPVYAIEDGYISRIKVEPGGYGKALFITHTNGITSLYAHLNNCTDDIEKYLRYQQYQNKSWQQDIVVLPGRFPVNKGDLVAYSGNTGHSEGPHLHFELRDTKTGNNLNPALYGFAVKDHTPPGIVGLYWYDRRYSTYEYGPRAISISGDNGEYKTRREIVKVTSPLISLGIRAEDRVDDSRFRYGIFRTQVWMDGELIHDVSMNNFSDSDSRYVNAYIDYSTRILKGQHIQHLSKLPGNQLPVFGNRNGLIHLRDNAPHEIHIRVSDIAGNESDLQFTLQKSSINPVKHQYTSNTKLMIPGQTNIVNGVHAVVQFPKQCFYDSVPFVYSETMNTMSGAVSPQITLHDRTVPVHTRYAVSIKSNLQQDNPLREKTVMRFVGFRRKAVVKGVWENNRMRAEFNELGTAQLFIDTSAPEIMPEGWANNKIFDSGTNTLSVKVKDNMGDIASFSAEIDDHWVLLVQKEGLFTYTFDEFCKPGKHKLTLKATDVAGNVAKKIFYFTNK